MENNIMEKRIFLTRSCPCRDFVFLNRFIRKIKKCLCIFFCGLTFLISVVNYAYFTMMFGMNELIANMDHSSTVRICYK